MFWWILTGSDLRVFLNQIGQQKMVVQPCNSWRNQKQIRNSTWRILTDVAREWWAWHGMTILNFHLISRKDFGSLPGSGKDQGQPTAASVDLGCRHEGGNLSRWPQCKEVIEPSSPKVKWTIEGVSPATESQVLRLQVEGQELGIDPRELRLRRRTVRNSHFKWFSGYPLVNSHSHWKLP